MRGWIAPEQLAPRQIETCFEELRSIALDLPRIIAFMKHVLL
jgi:hypothetical protein